MYSCTTRRNCPKLLFTTSWWPSMLAQLTGQTLGTVVKIQTFHLGVLFNGENCFLPFIPRWGSAWKGSRRWFLYFLTTAQNPWSLLLLFCTLTGATEIWPSRDQFFLSTTAEWRDNANHEQCHSSSWHRRCDAGTGDVMPAQAPAPLVYWPPCRAPALLDQNNHPEKWYFTGFNPFSSAAVKR